MPVDVEAEVLSNVRLSDEYNILSLAAEAIATSTAPGQFVMIKPSRGLDPLLRRPYSVFEIIDESGTPRGVSLLNKQVGAGSRMLYELRAGDRVACLGPLGVPFETVGPPQEALMVAGGVGVAPFATLAAALARRGTRSTLFYGARTGHELFRVDLFASLGVRLVLSTEDGSRGARGFVTAPLEDELRRLASSTDMMVYACGPTAMMRAVATLAERYRRPLRVSLEPVMGCGLGGCYSCVVKVRANESGGHYVRACVEGPVFDGATVMWGELDQ